MTLTGHCYLSRGLYANRTAFDGWPEALRSAMKRAVREAIATQRELAVKEEEIARRTLRPRAARSST